MTEQTVNFDDLELNAEYELAEKLFSVDTIEDNDVTKREKSIRKIATSLFLSHFDPVERDELLFGPKSGDQGAIEEYVDKADKIYETSGNLDSSYAILKFLKMIDPKLARKVIDSI